MARWGSVDYEEFKRLGEKLNKTNEAQILCEQMAKDIAAKLLTACKTKTPTGVVPNYIDADVAVEYWSGYKGGTLKKAWQVQKTVTKKGNMYEVEVFNPTEYASYVEYGHRLRAGQYVPTLGKKLKSSWQQGSHMMTMSEAEIENITPRLVEKKLNKWLQEIFNND